MRNNHPKYVVPDMSLCVSLTVDILKYHTALVQKFTSIREPDVGQCLLLQQSFANAVKSWDSYRRLLMGLSMLDVQKKYMLALSWSDIIASFTLPLMMHDSS